LLHDLKGDFALNELGPHHYFLGIEVSRSDDGINLSQKRYTVDILQRAGMTTCKPTPTPLSSNTKILVETGTLLSAEDATKY
jgi:hypothetical protein